MTASIVVPGEPDGKILFNCGINGDVSLMIRIGNEGLVSICRAAPGFIMLKGGVKDLAWIIIDVSTGGQSVADVSGVLGIFRESLSRAAYNMGVSTDEPFSKRWGSLKKSSVLDFAKNVASPVGSDFESLLMSTASASSMVHLRKAYSMACFLNPFDDVRAAVAASLAADVLST